MDNPIGLVALIIIVLLLWVIINDPNLNKYLDKIIKTTTDSSATTTTTVASSTTCCAENKKEGFKDMCTIYAGGDTDDIQQDRMRGLEQYCKKSKSCYVVNPAAIYNNENTFKEISATNKIPHAGAEAYTDYSQLSAEDASGRKGYEEQTDFGWTGKAPKLTQEWSNEQLQRVYQGDLCRGDQRIVEKMREIGQRAQQSIIQRAAYGKHSLLPYVSEELDAAESVDWWTDDQDLDAQMVKDEKKY